MSNKNGSLSGKGYYIALILCAAAIGVTGYLYQRNANKVQEVSIQEPVVENLMVGATQASEAPATQPTKPKTGNPSKTEGTAQATEPTASMSLETAAPLKGDTIGEYAMECLSYNETTRDWRVHNGIDLAAPEGAEVCAAANGTVYAAYEDDTLGHTVVIRHIGGYTTQYSNLRDDLCVAAGDSVTLGQTIGYVGTSALVETAMAPHLHFSVSCQNVPISPDDFLMLG